MSTWTHFNRQPILQQKPRGIIMTHRNRIRNGWIVRSSDNKGISITNAFQNYFDEFGSKKNKTWVDEGS